MPPLEPPIPPSSLRCPKCKGSNLAYVGPDYTQYIYECRRCAIDLVLTPTHLRQLLKKG